MSKSKLTLSDKVCNLLEIKPVYGLLINFGDLDNNYQLVTDKRKYRLIADYRWQVDSEEELKYGIGTYLPDFEKDTKESYENFALLVEAVHTVMPITINNDKKSFREMFLQSILEFDNVEYLKDKVSNIEWAY